MNSIFSTGSSRGEVEFFKNHVIDVRVIFQPLPDSHLVRVIGNMIEYSSTWFIFIRTDEETRSITFIPLFTILLLPDIFM